MRRCSTNNNQAACGLQTLLLMLAATALSAHAATVINVDAKANQRPINPNIYGVAFAASAAALADMNVPLHRQGGNTASRYNWLENADNKGMDWFFESIGEASATSGEHGDTFISDSKQGGAQPMLTIPLLPYVAKLGPSRAKTCSFSQAKYGAQQNADWSWFADAGNGVLSSGANVVNNNPLDANIPSNSTLQQAWVQHLVSKWGSSAAGGLKYYLMDNEPSIWFSTHRDVFPNGPTMDDIKTRIIDYAQKVKAVDAGALVVGPEEWGWSGYTLSGADQQYGSLHGWGSTLPDRAAHGGQDYLPWLLSQMKQYEQTNGKRLLDIFSVHFYPQGNEFSTATDTNTKLLRNRSTRQLWDPAYVSESWISDKVKLIPRLKSWVNTYYPNTPIAVTEYSWGADADMNGATAQADVLGIFGREGLDMGVRWTAPDPNTPTYQAFKMFRNYDSAKSTFGDVSVSASVPQPDELSAFAALRSADQALTLIVVNKALSGSTAVTATFVNASLASTAQVWSLVGGAIARQPDVSVGQGALSTSLPAQSVTLFVLKLTTTPVPSPSPSPAASPSPVKSPSPSASPSPSPSPAKSPSPSPVKSPSPSPAKSPSPSPVKSPSPSPAKSPSPSPAKSPSPSPAKSPSPSPAKSPSPSPAKSPSPSPSPSLTPAFTSTATINPSTVAMGATVQISISVTLTQGSLYAGNVDVEVYQGGTKVFQQFVPQQSFTPAAHTLTYTFNWPTASVGSYNVAIGVFDGGWSVDYHWNGGAAAGLVTAPPDVPVFSSTATVSPPAVVALGGSAQINVGVTLVSGSLSAGIVDVEVYRGGTKVFQQYVTQQSFSQTGAMQAYSFTWTPTAIGSYTVEIGVFSGTWSYDYHWNGAAATITVT